MRSMPLRVTLVLTSTALLAAALVVTGLVATTSLHAQLLRQTDSQLADASASLIASAGRELHARRGNRDDDGVRLPSAYYVAVYDASGALTGTLSEPLRAGQSPPALPEHTPGAGTITVDARDGSTSWRVRIAVQNDGTGSIAVATSLAEMDRTVSHLRGLELIVGAMVLLGLGALSFLLVGRALRPLRGVETTAAAIARGELSQRIPATDGRSEVGRLSIALNDMLAQIEHAFSQQSASEADARTSQDRLRRFVADASHELRTPLTTIRGYAEMHRLGALPTGQDVVRAMSRIESEAARLGGLVHDLLLLAQLDERRPLDRLPVDLLALVGDGVSDARVHAPEHRVSLEIGPTPKPPVITADPARVQQIVLNLLTNAERHTPAGTAVTVRLWTDQSQAVFEVADDGPGLQPDQAARVFDRFYRADPTRTRATGGTGLGLAIVAALVEAHDGTITVVSTPGTGTVFRVAFPLRADLADTQRDCDLSGVPAPGSR